MFICLFDEGMVFVEEIVVYLDGLGCEDLKMLLCRIVFVYVGESMCFIICFM